MADKYANAKCFILSEDGYDEITYSELCRRRDIDGSYKGRQFTPPARDAHGGDHGEI